MRGFSLIELLTVLVIVGLLVSVALPSYQSYIRRAHYTEVISAAAPYKAGVEACYQITGRLKDCNDGQNDIPKALEPATAPGLVDQIRVRHGEITITPKNQYGITSADNLIITPSSVNGFLKWHRHGGGVEQGYVRS